MVDAPLGFKSGPVQRVRRLLRERSYRNSQKMFVLEGLVALSDALKHGAPIDSIFVNESTFGQISSLDIDVPINVVADDVVARLGSTVSPQPVFAIAKTIDVSIESLQHAHTLLVAADIQDPGNAGALIRSAAASGCDGVIFTGESVDVYNPKVVRASAASLFSLPIVVEKSVDIVLESLNQWKIRSVATDSRSRVSLWDTDLSDRTAFVVGNEAHGLGQLAERCDLVVSIPLQHGIESLTAAMASTVCLFEAARQRAINNRGADFQSAPLMRITHDG